VKFIGSKVERAEWAQRATSKRFCIGPIRLALRAGCFMLDVERWALTV